MDRKKDTIDWKKGKMPQHGDEIVVKVEDFGLFILCFQNIKII
jgi:hypothetical protein